MNRISPEVNVQSYADDFYTEVESRDMKQVSTKLSNYVNKLHDFLLQVDNSLLVFTLNFSVSISTQLLISPNTADTLLSKTMRRISVVKTLSRDTNWGQSK